MGFAVDLQRPYNGPTAALLLGKNGVFRVKAIRKPYGLLTGFW